MKKLWLLLLTIITLVAVVAGCGTQEYEATPAEPDVVEDYDTPDEPEEQETPAGLGIHGLISRVEYGDNVAYIFGSMHLGRETWYPLYETVEDAMQRADVFAFEIDLTPEGQEEMLAHTMRYMLLPDGTTLQTLLPEDVFEQFSETLASYGMPIELLETFTPWVVSTIVTEMAYSAVGITAEHGIDMYVLNFALENEKPVIGLNEINHEVGLLLDLPMELQVYAARSLVDLSQAIEETEQLAQAYETQDIDKILYLLRVAGAEDYDENPFVRYMVDVLIIQRSVEFAQEIIRLLEETEEPTTFFITMGIGHMVGEDNGNVLYYLANAGFEVAPVFRSALRR